MPAKKKEINPLAGSKLQVPAFLSRPGGMSERIREFNWKDTKLGPVDSWSQSLRSSMNICLNSNFPIGIYWGEELLLLYNDAWSPIPGNKHPWALGRPAKEVWPEIWEEIAPQFNKAFSGEPGGSKNAMLPMQRHGYTEECYFDFTFTPVYGEDGEVDGIFNAVIETTSQLIHDRRTVFLHTLSQNISGGVSVAEVLKKIDAQIRKHPEDITFCYVYRFSENGEPQLIEQSVQSKPIHKLPYEELKKTGSIQFIPALGVYLDNIPKGAWPELPSEALLVPMRANNGSLTGFIFAGLSARRRHDLDYQLFVESVAAVVSSALNSIGTLEEERKRMEETQQARIQLEKSESALRLANAQLELTFRHVPAAIYLFDKTGHILFANGQAQSTTGSDISGNHMVGLHIGRIHERTSEKFELLDEQGRITKMNNTPAMITFRTSKAEQQVIQLVSKTSQERRWILATASPLLDNTGELSMVLASSTDITLQKLAEEKIRDSEENFRNLTQALPQLVWVTNASGRQEFVNERWKEYTGLDPLDIRTWAAIIHPDDSHALAYIWTSSLKDGNTYKTETRLKGKDGNYRWFHVHGEPIYNDKREIVRWVGAFTDIHEQKLAEELLRQSEGRLEFLVRKRTEELERSNEDLQQFAHVASHDLKEPIRKIKIFSGLLEAEIDPAQNEKAKLYLSKVQSAADRMLSMMEGVLRYAGLDGYQQEAGVADINEIIQSVLTDLEIVIEKRQAKIRYDRFPKIPGYSLLIYQLFYNLLSNALKFSKSTVTPVIKIEYQEELVEGIPFAEITIIDNGIGFEVDQGEKIFNTFLRLNSKEDYEGTGLGLSLCKKIVSRHNGYITARGEPGQGAEFTVLLPLESVRM